MAAAEVVVPEVGVTGRSRKLPGEILVAEDVEAALVAGATSVAPATGIVRRRYQFPIRHP
eukprot:scaffold7431_cov185-Isochrysis_galbana.AAC.1